ncbi:MAG: glycosyltransferase family 4 protein [Euryarchaeota archaeon]|nr:glycosyltransferase family 4 protein [Euryarchaeota archaeon]
MLDPLFFPYMGGTEKVVKEVGARLVRNHGHEVQVLTSMIPQANGSEVEYIDGMQVIRSPSLYLERLPGFLPPPFTLSPLIRREIMGRCAGADVYHVHNRFWYPLSIYHEARQRGELSLTIHNARPRGISEQVDRWGGLFDDIVGRKVFELCDHISCVSQATLDDTIPIDHQDKAEVIYNGVDISLYRPGLDASELRETLGLGPGPIILSNGRLVEQKGFPTLINAMRLVRDAIKDAQLVIIGRGPMKDDLIELARKNGLEDSIRFVTGIPEEELPRYYNMCDVFTLASYYEPAGIVLLEAMSCGRAVVASDVGGIPEMISNDCGVLVPSRDHEALGSELIRIISDTNLRRSMEHAARNRAVDHFDWDIIARRWDLSYREIVE